MINTRHRQRAGLPNVTIQQLEYLVAAVDRPTWSAAAEQLAVSPSALSQGLAELERRLGMKLFEPDGRKRILARQAQPVLAYARLVVAETSALARWIEGHREGSRGELRVGMIDTAAVGYFTEHLKTFRRTHPDLDFRLTVGPSRQLIDQLVADELDVAVAVRPAEQPVRTDMVELVRDPLRIYAPTAAAQRPPNEWGPWLTFPPSSRTRALTEVALEAIGASFEIVAESHQPEVLREMVRLELGWTVLPVIQAEAQPRPLEPARAEPLFERTIVALRRSGAASATMTDAFVSFLDPGVDWSQPTSIP